MKIRLSIISLLVVLTIQSCQVSVKTGQTSSLKLVNDTIFYSNGKIEEIIQFNKKGQKHGINLGYFENGHIEYIRNYLENREVGSQYWFYKSGKLQMYSVRNKEDSVFFYLNLDANGNVIEKIGTNIYPVYGIDGGKDTLQLNETYHLNFLYADPKVYKFNLDSVTLETDRSNNLFKNYFLEEEKGIIHFVFKPKERGNIKLTLYSSLKDKKGILKYGQILDILLFVR